jgi:LCP family protein required for cell wall assembly
MADDRGRGHRPRRTWPERLAIVVTFVSAVVCFVVAAGLVGGYVVVRQRNIVDLQDPAEVAAAGAATGGAAEQAPPPTLGPTSSTLATSVPTSSPAEGSAPQATGVVESTAADATTSTVHERVGAATLPVATFPEADPEASNFLITGADNGACIDPDSPYAGAFGDREGMGERSDTIMVLRVDPEADRVALLSFPRDLYVDIADGGRSRINSAYRRNEPQRLIDTIYENFGVPIDHYIQVDFCAFKTLVDAVGGVAVPVEFPARDANTGLNVPTTGCFVFDGEHALAYVRSRHYEYEDPPGSGNWQEDPSSDLGRVSRQQDFIRRTLSSILDEGPLNPRVARGLIRAATEYVVTDRDLTAARMLEFAGVMNDVDPTSILTYQIEATPRTISGAAVLEPNTDGDNMQAILAMFRGETSLADAPAQRFEETSTAAPRGSTTSVAAEGSARVAETTTSPATSTPTTSTPATPTPTTTPATTTPTTSTPTTAPATVAPETSVDRAGPQENQVGIVPPRDATC